MKRLYLLGLFELSMIFQDLGNIVYRAMEHYFGQITGTIFDDIVD